MFALREEKERVNSFVKRFTSKAFYKFINGISGREVIQDNVSYFRLMTKRVVKIIMDMPETERLFKSEATYVGFKTKIIEFDRPERAAGKTKYNYRKLFKLAFRTITCSTNALLYLPLHIGIAFSSIGFLGFVTTLVLLFVNGDYSLGYKFSEYNSIVLNYFKHYISSRYYFIDNYNSLLISTKPHGQYST